MHARRRHGIRDYPVSGSARRASLDVRRFRTRSLPVFLHRVQGQGDFTILHNVQNINVRMKCKFIIIFCTFNVKVRIVSQRHHAHRDVSSRHAVSGCVHRWVTGAVPEQLWDAARRQPTRWAMTLFGCRPQNIILNHRAVRKHAATVHISIVL
jgi:hypothetical protein